MTGEMRQITLSGDVVLWEINSRSLDVTEPCTLDFQAWFGLQSDFTDLTADMLSLAIAVGPDEEGSGKASLPFDIFSNRLLVLRLRGHQTATH